LKLGLEAQQLGAFAAANLPGKPVDAVTRAVRNLRFEAPQRVPGPLQVRDIQALVVRLRDRQWSRWCDRNQLPRRN
jgi:hypothetical protein